MQRSLFEPEHDAFRDAFRTFVAQEITPHYAAWEQAGIVPRELWRRAGGAGGAVAGEPLVDRALRDAEGGPGLGRGPRVGEHAVVALMDPANPVG